MHVFCLFVCVFGCVCVCVWVKLSCVVFELLRFLDLRLLLVFFSFSSKTIRFNYCVYFAF